LAPLSAFGLELRPAGFRSASPRQIPGYATVRKVSLANGCNLLQFKTWSGAEAFCRANRSRSLPILADESSALLLQTVLQRLHSQRLHLCTSWLALHTSDISSSVNWRWMDPTTKGRPHGWTNVPKHTNSICNQQRVAWQSVKWVADICKFSDSGEYVCSTFFVVVNDPKMWDLQPQIVCYLQKIFLQAVFFWGGGYLLPAVRGTTLLDATFDNICFFVVLRSAM